MGEEFKPRFFKIDPESGEMKPTLPSPEELEKTKKEEKGLEKKERKRTIRLNQEATFADLFGELDKIEEKIQEGKAEEDIDNLDPTGFIQEFYDHFDDNLAEEVLVDFRTKLESLKHKKPEEYTSQERELANLKVLGYFQDKGYSIEDIEVYLPVKFKKDKQGK